MSVDATTVRTVTVRLFAAAKERAGSETVSVPVPVGADICDLRAALAESVPELKPLAAQLLFAVGTTYARDEDRLPASGDIVAFPPVSGG